MSVLLRSFVAAILISLLVTGCGPLVMPLTNRLMPEDQKQIDTEWDNMLTPVNRLSRQTLLDTTVMYWLYRLGVDRLRLVSKKYLTHGKVVMEIDCDRASPESDEFIVSIVDDRGQTLRRERYMRKDVEESAQALWGCASHSAQSNSELARAKRGPTTGPADGPTTVTAPESRPTDEEKRREAEGESS